MYVGVVMFYVTYWNSVTGNRYYLRKLRWKLNIPFCVGVMPRRRTFAMRFSYSDALYIKNILVLSGIKSEIVRVKVSDDNK